MTEVSKAALAMAVTQLGKQEIPRGSNWGPAVKEYLNSVGIDFPASWCMGFVYWCFQKTGMPSSILKTGGVMRQYNERHQNVVSSPQPGDVFIMDFGGGLGHTGIVENVDGDSVHTIEGNTNDTGSREGFEVCRRVRSIKKIKAFLRF